MTMFPHLEEHLYERPDSRRNEQMAVIGYLTAFGPCTVAALCQFLSHNEEGFREWLLPGLINSEAVLLVGDRLLLNTDWTPD